MARNRPRQPGAKGGKGSAELAGSLLQGTSTIAGISVALYAALYALGRADVGVVIPKAIMGGLGVSGNLTLLASVALLNSMVAQTDEEWPWVYFSLNAVAYTFWGTIVLWFVYIMLVFPGIPAWLSGVFEGSMP